MACANNPTPTPTPVPNIMPGDTCNAANNDVCNNGGKCTNSVCVAAKAIGAVCAKSPECPLGSYCDPTALVCKAVVAPQGACTPDPNSLSNQVDQCGYHGYCINSKCTVPHSLPSGTTGVLSTAAGASQSFISRLCQSGYATIDTATNTYFCAAAPFSPTANVGKGQATSAMCTVTVTDSKGATTQANTAASSCGYNQDNLFYCPYAIGDAPIQAIMTALNTANFYSLRS